MHTTKLAGHLSGTLSANTSFGSPAALWTQRREATLNWLALGLLLAAWNAADDSGSPRRRPDSLRAFPHVTVRAMTRIGSAASSRSS
jgi:hypothetical protein